MKNLRKKTVAATVFVIALALLLAITARAAVAQDAKPVSGNQPTVAEGIAFASYSGSRANGVEGLAGQRSA